MLLFRWRTDFDKVQKTLDELPPEQDQSEQVDDPSGSADTISDKFADEHKQEVDPPV